MKSIKWSSMVFALCYIGLGAYFIINPYLAQEDLCLLIGYVMIILGVGNVLLYFARKMETSFYRSDFQSGLILITIGAIAIAYKPLFIELVYLIMGIIIMISGYSKLQDCVDTWRLGSSHGILYLILALISIGVGLLIITNPFLQTVTVHYVIGVGLIYSGISDLFSSIYLSSKMIRFKKNKENENREETKEEKQEEVLETNQDDLTE